MAYCNAGLCWAREPSAFREHWVRASGEQASETLHVQKRRSAHIQKHILNAKMILPFLHKTQFAQNMIFRAQNCGRDITPAKTAAHRICTVARYNNIYSKADRGDFSIVHDQKASYRTPLGRNRRPGPPDHKGTLATYLKEAGARARGDSMISFNGVAQGGPRSNRGGGTVMCPNTIKWDDIKRALHTCLDNSSIFI